MIEIWEQTWILLNTHSHLPTVFVLFGEDLLDNTYCLKNKPTYYYSTEAAVRKCSVKKGVRGFRNSAKLTGKYMCWSLLLNKVAGSLQLRQSCEIFKNTYFQELQ